jgi:hypothetical protein
LYIKGKDMGDEEIYLEATREAEGENRDPALWAKAMALCEGDAGKAKYEYIRCRVESQLEKNKYTEKDEQHLRVESNGKPATSPEEDAKTIEARSKENIYGNQNKKVVSATTKSFKIYKHPVQGYEVIKNGFSWPGFLFTWIWAFVKKLWVQGTALLVAVFICNSLGFEIAGGGVEGSFVGLLISLIPMCVAGLKGNEWRDKSMSQRGYTLEGSVIAESSEGALAEATKPAGEREQKLTDVVTTTAKEDSFLIDKLKLLLVSVGVFISISVVLYMIMK